MKTNINIEKELIKLTNSIPNNIILGEKVRELNITDFTIVRNNSKSRNIKTEHIILANYPNDMSLGEAIRTLVNNIL